MISRSGVAHAQLHTASSCASSTLFSSESLIASAPNYAESTLSMPALTTAKIRLVVLQLLLLMQDCNL